MKLNCKKIVLAGFCLSFLPVFGFAQGKEETVKQTGWTIVKTAQLDSKHVWSAGILYAHRQKKDEPIVCALDYEVIPPDHQNQHPFVLLVSRMSREFWTTDRAWTLTGREDGKATLKTDKEKFTFNVDPENAHIFMSLIKDQKIDAVLDALSEAKKADIHLKTKRKVKEISLPLKDLPPVLDAFRKCLESPAIAYGQKPNSKVNDSKLPEVFKE